MKENISLRPEFADNPDPRVACVLLLDTSASMSGEPIQLLNEGVQMLRDSLLEDPLARRRVELSVVSFNSSVTVDADFSTVEDFVAPHLVANGLTHMGEGLITALDLVEGRKSLYKQNGIAYYRPWIFLITDGEPQGEAEHVTREAAARVQLAERNSKVAVFAIGVEGANMSKLQSLVVRDALKLRGLDFLTLFKWFSSSMSRVSQSNPGDQLALPAPDGWASL